MTAKEHYKLWYVKNRQRKITQVRKWQSENKEKQLGYQRKWNANNRDYRRQVYLDKGR